MQKASSSIHDFGLLPSHVKHGFGPMKLRAHTEIQNIEACVLYIKLNNWLLAKHNICCWMRNTLSWYYIPLIMVWPLLTRLELSAVNTVQYRSTGAVSVEEVTW